MDLWSFDIESLKWQRKPEPLMLTCHGLEYDGDLAATSGHFMADSASSTFSPVRRLARPGAASNPFPSSDHPTEHTFRNGWRERHLKEYHAKTVKTSNNCSTGRGIEQALPVNVASFGLKARRILKPGWTRLPPSVSAFKIWAKPFAESFHERRPTDRIAVAGPGWSGTGCVEANRCALRTAEG